jgi:hypothetical protein
MGSVPPTPHRSARQAFWGNLECAARAAWAKRGWHGRFLAGQILAGIDSNVLFGKALGLGSGWKVVKSEMDVAGRELKIWLDFEPGPHFVLPAMRKVHFASR